MEYPFPGDHKRTLSMTAALRRGFVSFIAYVPSVDPIPREAWVLIVSWRTV